MKVSTHIYPHEFEAWAGAIETLRIIREAGKEEEFDSYAEEIFYDGVDETQFNDWLWFDADYILEDLGIESE